MSHSIKKQKAISLLAFELRRFPAFHQAARFVRRTLWSGLKEGIWEFARIIFKDVKDFGPPSKTFSIYKELLCKNPEYQGKIVLENQGTPEVSRDSLVVLSNLKQHLEQPWPIVWSEHINARLISNSLALINNEKELCIESVYGHERVRGDQVSKYLFWEKETCLSGKWTSIVSNWVPLDGIPIYGHWLHDALPRLAILDELPDDVGILVPDTLKPIHWEALNLMGLKDRCRPTKETNIVVEKYYFSSPTTMIDCYNPHGVNWMRKKLIKEADPSYDGPKKFFFARTGKRRAISNIEEITKAIEKSGWTVVNDMDLNLSQTIKLFSEATNVCGFLGSNMSNVIFCSEGCKVTHLVPDFFLDGWVDLIADVLKLDYKSVILEAGGSFAHRPKVKVDNVIAALRGR
jgi:hypothetical protein